MRRMVLLLIAGAAMGVLALCVGAASPKLSQASSEIEQLRQEVATLRQRVESLEERVEVRVRPIPLDPRHWPHQVPRDWRSIEFNGTRFYAIPIDNSSPPASEPKK